MTSVAVGSVGVAAVVAVAADYSPDGRALALEVADTHVARALAHRYALLFCTPSNSE